MAEKDAATTSWCDKLASVPTVGLHHPHRYLSSSTVLDRLSPLLSQLKEPSITRQDPMTLVIEDETGYTLSFSPIRTSIGYLHRYKVKTTSGDANPTVQMLSEPRPFTQLLEEVSNWLMRAVHALDPKATGFIDRLGIVSVTNLAEEDCPPGIRNLLAYLGRPWGQPLDKGYAVQMTNPLRTTEKFSDRCIHTLKRTEEEGALITANFDWQRVYVEPRSVRGLDDVLTTCHAGALQYFEDLAEGKNVNALLNN